MKSSYVILCCIILYFIVNNTAEACQCLKLKKLKIKEVANAEAIFIGKVVAIDSTDTWNKKILFEIIDNLKKDGRKQVSVGTGVGMGDCGLQIKMNQEWYIFTQKNEGEMYATICGRSFMLNNSLASIVGEYKYDNGVLALYADDIRRVAKEIKYIRKNIH